MGTTKIGTAGHLSMKFAVTGTAGVPATANVASVVVNLTAVNETAAGYLTAWSGTGTQPSVSNVNFVAGQAISNLAVVPVAADGTITVAANVATDAIVSIQGWYATSTGNAGGTYFPVTPTRVFDSRTGIGTGATRLGPGETRTVTPTVAGVPTTGVAAVTANITVTTTGSTSTGQFVSVWQSGAWPGTSNLNYTTGQTLAELVIVQANPDGTFQIRNGANAPVDLIVDVQGYTTIAENPAGDIYIGGTPTRLYDTRTASGFAGAGTGPVSGTRTIQISGGGSPIPDGSPAATVNLTVTSTTGTGTVTVWGAGAQPGTTNISFTAGQTVSNAAIVPLDQWGRIQLNVTGGTAQVIVDAAGYFRGDVNTWTYTYDALGNRRTAAGPPAKWNDTGNRTYQWSTAAGLPTLLVENRPWAALGGTDTYYWLYGPDSTPIAQVNPDGSLYYLHQDQLGSITLATNTTGAPISARAWDPYGKQTTSAGSAAWPIPFGWAGEYRDETGLINLRARVYDPANGQFLSRDPLVSVSRSTYGYASGDPLDRVDPSGALDFCLTGVAGHRSDGSEICYGASEIANNAWHGARTVLNGPTDVETLAIQRLSGADCRWNSENAAWVCSGGVLGNIAGPDCALTIGSTISTGMDYSSFLATNCGRLIAHETKHSDQFAVGSYLLGPGPGGIMPFRLVDALQASVHKKISGGDVERYELVEYMAGLDDGGYNGPPQCGCGGG